VGGEVLEKMTYKIPTSRFFFMNYADEKSQIVEISFEILGIFTFMAGLIFMLRAFLLKKRIEYPEKNDLLIGFLNSHIIHYPMVKEFHYFSVH